ncbi:hypothetical protein AMATHDRAFT_59234 [Amanita thiersii Skay4041]|uniref:Uncharacterized protein n=1 Tax=Amanita thiersii Skay4041 TaxID=703135 RepID=A0A2A9NMX5_9AGAR|nr:hypothetical protein AMATHDRAFT_59234 [Amanita thiersii Skay4041]
MKDRRDRKRAKRAIIAPSVPRDSGDDGASDKHPKKGGRKKLIPAGFALMHGFSSTNVGKNRLTVPPFNIGVFQKGKASAKTNTDKSKRTTKKAREIICFSETSFLNKSSHKAIQQSKNSSGGLSSESSIETRELSLRRKAIKKPSNKRVPKVDLTSGFQDTKDSVTRHDTHSTVQSTELGYPLCGSILSVPPVKKSSVIIDVSQHEWAKASSKPNSPLENCGDPSEMVTNEALSIGPSQSASQCMASTRPSPVKVTYTETKSKYFSVSGPVSVQQMSADKNSNSSDEPRKPSNELMTNLPHSFSSLSSNPPSLIIRLYT